MPPRTSEAIAFDFDEIAPGQLVRLITEDALNQCVAFWARAHTTWSDRIVFRFELAEDRNIFGDIDIYRITQCSAGGAWEVGSVCTEPSTNEVHHV